MSSRRAYLDVGLGEARGVITLNGRPERLIIERGSDLACQQLGARSIARVRSVRRGLGLVFMAMPEGEDGILALGANQDLVEGASHEVSVAGEPQAGKGAVLRLEGETSGPPRLVEPAPEIETRLAAWAPGGVVTGLEAREIADEAQATALDKVHPLPGGGDVAIETTRALTAIDVDLGARPGGDAARAQRQANLAAIEVSARLLRLKGQGGLVVIDLAGRGHNGPVLSAAAKAAFAADEPGVGIGPISRFGLFELALPRRSTPVRERLCGPDGRLTAVTAALGLIRAIEREGRADPGGRIAARCAPAVGEAIKPWLPDLAGRLGARFIVEVDPSLPVDGAVVTCR